MTQTRRDFFLMSLLLLMILALAACVRFYNLDGQSLWSDEGNSAALATRSYAEITTAAAHDIHPPLYYWLLRGWVQIAGTSEAGLRSLSVLFGVLLVLATAELGRTLFGASTGLAAAFVAALAPFQVYYSQEARMYILVALMATLAVLFTFWLIRREANHLPVAASGAQKALPLLPPVAWLLALALAAGLYTHYAFPLIDVLVSALYICWLWASRARGQVEKRLVRWSALNLIALALYLPWIPVALRQLTTWPSEGSTMDWATASQVALATLAVGPIERAAGDDWWIPVSLGVAILGALPWHTLQAYLRPSVQAGTRSGEMPTLSGAFAGSPSNGASLSPVTPVIWLCPQWLAWITPLLWLGAPLAMMFAFGLFREAYLKFLLIASPAFSLLLARGVIGPAHALNLLPSAKTRSKAGGGGVPFSGLLAGIWVTLVLASSGALSGSAVVRYYSDPAVARDDYRSIAEFIAATGRPNDAILLDAPGQAEVFGYYYRGNLPVYPLPQQRPADRNTTLRDMEQLLAYDKIYALYWAAQEADPENIVEDWMNSRGYKTLDQWRGNVRLAVYVMPERSGPDEAADALNVQFGPDITLLGYTGWNLSPSAGEVTQLQLVWKAVNAPKARYKVFLQLLDANDQVIAQRDAEPAGESRPTSSWRPGETIVDNHGVLIRPGTPPGTYRRILGLYDSETQERLRLADGTDYVTLPPIRVQRSASPPTLAALDMRYTQEFDFGGITLLGHDRYKRDFRHAPDTPLHPGDRLHLTFYWQAEIDPRAEWWFALALNDDDGHSVASLQAPLVSESYATTLWQEREIVRGEHDLLIPADLPPGVYRLSLTLLPDTDTPAGAAYLGTIQVLP